MSDLLSFILIFSIVIILARFIAFIISELICQSLLKGLWTCYLGHALGFGVKWQPGENVWAIVTGATDGIGLEYARQLAAIGYNIFIISRSEEKLKKVDE